MLPPCMSAKSERSSVVDLPPFRIVKAIEGEEPDFWLLREEQNAFPLYLDELHDLMDAIDAFHDEAHPH